MRSFTYFEEVEIYMKIDCEILTINLEKMALPEQLEECLKRLKLLDAPFKFSINEVSAYAILETDFHPLDAVGWRGPGQDCAPNNIDKVINVEGCFAFNNDEEKNSIISKIANIKSFFQQTANIKMFNQCVYLSVHKTLLREQKSHIEYIRPKWYNELRDLLNKYDVNSDDMDKIQIDYDILIQNPLLLTDENIIIDQKAEYSPEQIHFTIEFPWILKSVIYLTDDRIQEIENLFTNF